MQPDFAEEDVGGLLGLRGRIRSAGATRIAWIVEDKISRSQHPVIIRKVLNVIDALRAAWTACHLPPVPWAAGIKRQSIVNRATIIVDECAIEHRIVERVASSPAIRGYRREPEMIRGDVARHLHVSPANHAFASRGIIWKYPREAWLRENVLREKISA